MTTLIGIPLRSFIDPTNLVMLYLLAVVLAALRLGRYPAVLASFLSVLAFDVFFVQPYNTFAVADAQFVLTFAALLGVGLLISTLAAQAREQEKAAQDRATHTRTLYELSRDLALVLDPIDVVNTMTTYTDRIFRGKAVLLLAYNEELKLVKQTDCHLDKQGLDVADRVFREGKPAECLVDNQGEVYGAFFPLRSTQGIIGVLGLWLSKLSTTLTSEQWRLLEAFASLAAQALTRINLMLEARQTQLLRESEKLQSALLNSISHDLRTPLASITGALSSLREDAAFLDEAARSLLINTAWEQAARLDEFVGNLLDMTRLEAGVRKVKPEFYDVQDLVGVALERLGVRLDERDIIIKVPETLPPAPIDLPLMAQALFNLVDNALKYSPRDCPIVIDAKVVDTNLQLAVIDEGPGIPAEDSMRIFNKFYRVQRSSEVAGIGLGLPISMGIVEAHGGRISVANRSKGGAVFTIIIPLEIPLNLQESEKKE
ncbi:MAG: DUF4118 domain-containing protein [Anaerolineales bacterium]|nr:DUF4118 domain-containing protein [Anaerolineales bacterium]